MATTDKVLSLLFVWKLRLQFWAEAVLESYGNITIDWLGANECVLENDDIYTDKGMKHASQET